MTTGINLKKARENLGFSVKEVSAMVGLSQLYIREIEKDERKVREKTLAKLCDAYRVRTEDILIEGVIVTLGKGDGVAREWKVLIEQGRGKVFVKIPIRPHDTTGNAVNLEPMHTEAQISNKALVKHMTKEYRSLKSSKYKLGSAAQMLMVTISACLYGTSYS